MELSELFDYKNLLMEDLCSNERIAKLVTGNDEAQVPNHGLPYTQIFPYEYIPETIDESKTFICYDVDVLSVPNKTFLIPVLYVWVFTHKSRMRENGGGVLIDDLSIEVSKMLNGNRNYGLGELDLDSVRRFTPIAGFLGRALTFYAKDFNRNGSKPAPATRRSKV
jgi:hypothetical protein